jgi:hypothetical protein
MTPERKARLEALEWWVWSVRATRVDWDARFDQLVAFFEANGRLPPRSTPGLGKWVNAQRQRRATMAPERKARLDALAWWTWNPYDDAWSTKFDELVAYHAEHGRLPPQSTPGLGTWVVTQRTKRATMTPERKARLDALPWWVWDPLDDAWSTKFDELVAYHAEHGRIPFFATPGGLGMWVGMQRKSRATMTPERKAQLEGFGWWVWDALDDAWSTNFDELVAYHAEHSRIPPQSTPGGARKLGPNAAHQARHIDTRAQGETRSPGVVGVGCARRRVVHALRRARRVLCGQRQDPASIDAGGARKLGQ